VHPFGSVSPSPGALIFFFASLTCSPETPSPPPVPRSPYIRDCEIRLFLLFHFSLPTAPFSFSSFDLDQSADFGLPKVSSVSRPTPLLLLDRVFSTSSLRRKVKPLPLPISLRRTPFAVYVVHPHPPPRFDPAAESSLSSRQNVGRPRDTGFFFIFS